MTFNATEQLITGKLLANWVIRVFRVIRVIRIIRVIRLMTDKPQANCVSDQVAQTCVSVTNFSSETEQLLKTIHICLCVCVFIFVGSYCFGTDA